MTSAYCTSFRTPASAGSCHVDDDAVFLPALSYVAMPSMGCCLHRPPFLTSVSCFPLPFSHLPLPPVPSALSPVRDLWPFWNDTNVDGGDEKRIATPWINDEVQRPLVLTKQVRTLPKSQKEELERMAAGEPHPQVTQKKMRQSCAKGDTPRVFFFEVLFSYSLESISRHLCCRRLADLLSVALCCSGAVRPY